MECAIILTCLHHCGVLDRVLKVDKERWPLAVTAITKNVAAAARAVRLHVSAW